jgi:hypothetical protein
MRLFPNARFVTKNHKIEISTSIFFIKNKDLFLLSQEQAKNNEPNIFARKFLRMFANL